MFDNVVDVTVKGGWDVAAAVADTVVGDAILWEVVGADFLAAVTATDEVAALGGKLGVVFVNLDL